MNGTIKSPKEIQALFKDASRFSTGTFIALKSIQKEKRDYNGRVAFIAGKRLGTAPVRNKAKRLLREAARRKGLPWQGIDVILIARPKTSRAKLVEIEKDLDLLFQRTKLQRDGK